MIHFPLQIDCIWDVYEMQEKRFESCGAADANVTTVYIGEDVKDCPCPWEASCGRVRVRGPGYATADTREKYG